MTLLVPQGGGWFFSGNGTRSLADLIVVYHGTVGRNCVLELQFPVDRTGRIAQQHAAMYARLGGWIKSCYGSPLASTRGPNRSPLAST